MIVLSEVEQEERKKLVGYCEHCDHHTKFHVDRDEAKCEKCGGKFSHRVGFQITTQRTFTPKRKGRK